MALKLELARDLELSVGFSGTQRGMTSWQQERVAEILLNLFNNKQSFFHHGDCSGADAQAALTARVMGYILVCHPPDNAVKRAFVTSKITHKPRPYLKRNMDIAVAASDALLICPKEPYEVIRSGTWSTYRYGQKLKRNILLILPNGTIKHA